MGHKEGDQKRVEEVAQKHFLLGVCPFRHHQGLYNAPRRVFIVGDVNQNVKASVGVRVQFYDFAQVAGPGRAAVLAQKAGCGHKLSVAPKAAAAYDGAVNFGRVIFVGPQAVDAAMEGSVINVPFKLKWKRNFLSRGYLFFWIKVIGLQKLGFVKFPVVGNRRPFAAQGRISLFCKQSCRVGAFGACPSEI